MSPVTLYKKQKQILDFLSQYIQSNSYSPTLQEIADAMGLSSLATVHEHLQALERKNVIKRYDGAVRGIEIVDNNVNSNLSAIELPLVGYIVAGEPIHAFEEEITTVMVSPDMVSKSKRCFVLQVKGDSMINEHIEDGDYVVLKQQETANDGDKVVALIDNEFATLKIFYKEKGGKIRLQPANDKMDPIIVDSKQLTIQGVVTGIIRRYA
ncbi:MAG: transcriptional repressor LexA [Patescibacteria group bacterium]|nr:transcriptional repressor LexA [Patescibacteria group bacterium]